MEARKKTMITLLDEKVEEFGIDSLTASERWFYAICWFIRETNCNAIQGYFFNHGGANCQSALHGLELVGAVETAGILGRAIALFPGGNVPVNHAARQIALGDLGYDVEWGVLSRLTDELFALKEDVAALVEIYTSAHRDEFPTFYGSQSSDAA
jgi:hypothetical protein